MERGPSPEAWQTILEVLTPLAPDTLAIAVDLLPALRAWPASVRALMEAHPWARSAFEPAPSPGLALVGRARLTHRFTTRDRTRDEVDEMEMLRRMARRLDPSFDPPRTVMSQGDDIRYANGCGGGHAWLQLGDPARWIRWSNHAVENSGDMVDHEAWTAHGMASGCAVVIQHHNPLDHRYEIALEGEAPAVFDCARAWGAQRRGGLSLEAFVAVLERG